MQTGGVYNGWEFVFAQIQKKSIIRYIPSPRISILMLQGAWCVAFQS